ncbi:MAG: hypothetical protein IRY99_17140 [Isosphaeraceae bacterium]|nr:hypothetical protein [Isosphaeraceae bacterium]
MHRGCLDDLPPRRLGPTAGHGKEPDTSFYFAHAAAIADKATINLDIDPLPDL